MRYTLLPLLLCSLAANPPTTRHANTGHLNLSFRDRSPLSSVQNIANRMGVTRDAMLRMFPEKDYSLAAESFELYVPKSYTGEKPFGLLVWVSPGPTGNIPADWTELADRHQLICAGANKSGNDRPPFIRLGLALDAAFNIPKLYSIDQARIFVAGLSGGGRVSSMLAMGFPDCFKGGIYLCGSSYYRKMLSTEQNGASWRPEFLIPPATVLAIAKKHPHVFITGSTDINREQTQIYSQAYARDGFQQVTYIEVPGMGHQLPEIHWIDKALQFLDRSEQTTSPSTRPTSPNTQTPASAPSNDKASAQLQSALQLAPKDPVAAAQALQHIALSFPSSKEAVEATLQAEKLMADPKIRNAVHDRAEADKLIRVARIYLDNQMLDQAKSRLKKVLDEYPHTPSAPLAAKMLQELK